MIVSNRYVARYHVNVDGSYELEHFEAYDKDKYRSGAYVFGHIVVHGVDELEGFKNALMEVEKRGNKFKDFLNGFVESDADDK